MPSLVLGVSGSVAAYRACDLARDLMREGWTVRACLTDGAEKFVSPALFEALTGQPCLQDTFEEPEKGRMAHIDWARAADVLLIAPATANTINGLAAGLATDMLTTLALAYEGPLVVAPAMNPSMYAHEATRAALLTLAARAAQVVEPTEGDVACGESGQGKLASNAAILETVRTITARSQKLAGKRVLITSGPTQEPIDDVRFLTNRSSGRMGAALARAALLMGAEVTVVTGPTSTPLPLRASVERVRTAEQMLAAVKKHLSQADFVIGAAAVADYRPANPVRGKIRRGEEPERIELVPNPDIIAEATKSAQPGARVVAFAAEPDPGLETAAEKLKRKGVFAIAVNDVSRSDAGFESETNDITLLRADGKEERSGLMGKLACALWLLERVAD